MRNKIQIVFLFLILLLPLSCDDNDYDKELEQLTNKIELLEKELAEQKAIIEALKSNTTISHIEQKEDSYTIFFSNGKSITLTNGKTPIIAINAEGYWTINGESTGYKAEGTPGHSPQIEIGENGNWWIDGKDTGKTATGPSTNSLTNITDLDETVVFTFSDGTSITINKIVDIPYFKNNPLPINDDTLRVLCIGNSYTLDAIAHLHCLAWKSGIDLKRIVVYVLVYGGSTFEYWVNNYASGEQVRLARAAGDLTMKKTGTMKEILHQDWDVVTLQQKSSESIYYDTFNPHLRKLVNIIRRECPNQNLAFAWQMVWGFWPGFGGAPYGIDRYNAIRDATKEMLRKDGIDIIIPIGTAIENARATHLQTEHSITRDGFHLCYGVGRYIAACTWFQTIIAPVFNKSILGNPYTYEITEDEKKTSNYESQSVTEANRELCQLCAFYSTIDRFHVTPIEEIP